MWRQRDMTKWEFVERELIADSIHAAFQRANVYSDSSDIADPKRQDLRKRLARQLRESAAQYFRPVSDHEHELNIQKISDHLTSEFRGTGLLLGNKFRIGIAQKALNLYLKYLWCLEKIPTPPHCPFDDRIIAKLRSLTEQQKQGLQWTKLDSLDGYQTLVKAARNEIGSKASLAEWEPEEWKSDYERKGKATGI
jgi:hypothetical protein